MRLLGTAVAGALVLGAAAIAAAAAAMASGAPEAEELRVQGVELANGRAAVVVAGVDLRSEGDLTDLFEVRADGEARAADVDPIEPRDVEVALVVDNSADQPIEQFRELQNVAMELALRLDSTVRVGVVTMGDPPGVAAAVDSDVLERAAAAGRIEAEGPRALYDAVALAAQQLSDRAAIHRRIVVVAGGEDQASTATPEALLEHLPPTAVYVVRPAGARQGALAELAAASGGLVVNIDETDGALGAASAVLSDLRDQYRLTFEAHGGAAVTIRVASEAVTAETSLELPPSSPSPGEDARDDVATPADPAPDDEDATEVLGAPAAPGRTLALWPWLLAATGAGLLVLLLVRSGPLLVRQPPALAHGRHSHRRTLIGRGQRSSRLRGRRSTSDAAPAPAGPAPGRAGATPASGAAADALVTGGRALARAAAARVARGRALARAGAAAVAAGARSVASNVATAFTTGTRVVARAVRSALRWLWSMARTGWAGVARMSLAAARAAAAALRRSAAIAAAGASAAAGATGDAVRGARRGVGRGQAVARTAAAARSAGRGVARAVRAFGHGVVGAVAGARRAAGAVARRGRERLQPVRVSEEALATEVYRDVGGDQALLNDVAQRLAAIRQHTAAQMHGAGLEGRLAVALLVSVPVVAGLFRALREPAYLQSLTAGPLGWLTLGCAATLVVIGGLWLRRVTKPPFTWRPSSWRAHARRSAREQLLSEGLDRACLYAVAGLDLEAALRRALPDQHPARALVEHLHAVGAGGRSSAPGPPLPPDTPAWLTTLSHADQNTPAADLLAAARARLQVDSVEQCNQQAHRMLPAAIVPFLACILPATLLLGLVTLP